MRQDILIAYLAVLGINLITLIIPVPVVVQMLVATTATIYIGCYNGVPQALDTITLKSDQSGSDGEPGANGAKSPRTHTNQEKMNRKDVYLFPVIGSVVLFSLYLTYKILPKIVLTVLVKVYFLLIGMFCLGDRFAQLTNLFLKGKQASEASSKKKEGDAEEPIVFTVNFFPLVSKIYDVLPASVATYLFAPAEPKKADESKKDGKKKENDNKGGKPALEPTDYQLPLTQTQAYCLAAAGVVGVWYILTGHWLSSNLFGIAFSIQGIELIHLGSVLNGVILLSALFFYDIFWVFGTDVMVTVAKNFDAPIKLLFPRVSMPNPAMLGLGDIVIPGIFIAMMLRYDVAQILASGKSNKDDNMNSKSNSARSQRSSRAAGSGAASSDIVSKIKTWINLAPYYHTCLISYVFGLVATLVVMYTFEAAQPALLYLVPACVGSVMVRAAIEGKLSNLINYEEADEEEKAQQASSS